jgi:glycosyltransferase involved in cell wall biosynthesis
MKLVTIILPTFNRAKFISRAINSVINQSYSEWELIIIDDGSTDETNLVVKEYLNKHKNIKYFYHRNRGVSYSMNVGIDNSCGEYLTFLGSDDEFSAEHLKIRVEYMIRNSEADIIHSPAKIIGNKYVKDKNDKSRLIHLDNCIIGGTLFGKSKIFKKLNGFKDLNYSPESEFIERAEVEHKIREFNYRTYIYYRDTPDSICNNI